MIALCQRVSEAFVTVNDVCVSKIGLGWLVFLGVFADDTKDDALYLAKKIINLRGFSDENGHFNLNLGAVEGAVLIVSQFTLCADTRKGNRPSFSDAAAPELARPLYEYFVHIFQDAGIKAETGQFGASMAISLCNSGPVTFYLNTAEMKKKPF